MKPLYFKYDKYIPYTDFDINSAEEMMAVLKKQSELIERRGLTLTQHASSWMDFNSEAGINGIYRDRLTPYHDHDYYEINYVFNGILLQYIEGKELIMNSGELLIIPPGIRHESFPIGKETNAYNILITERFVKKTEKLMSEYNNSNYLNYLMNHKSYILFVKTTDHGIDKIIRECTRSYSKKLMYSELLTNNITERLLIILASCERYDQLFNTGNINDTRELGERILQYMYEHYADINLEELAKKFGYSAQHIRRIIKKHTGYSFITALQHKRMERAMHLLRTTTLSVKEIAEIVGLESPEYFTRRFKFERNETPTEFRKRQNAANKTSTASK